MDRSRHARLHEGQGAGLCAATRCRRRCGASRRCAVHHAFRRARLDLGAGRPPATDRCRRTTNRSSLRSRNRLYRQQVNPAADRKERPDNAYARSPGDPRYPHVLTTYRLTEHHTAGGMSRTLSHLAELQPELFCEISPALAQGIGVPTAKWVRVTTARGAIDARALVTPRLQPLIVPGPHRPSSRPALSFRRAGARPRRRRQRPGRDLGRAECQDHGSQRAPL